MKEINENDYRIVVCNGKYRLQYRTGLLFIFRWWEFMGSSTGDLGVIKIYQYDTLEEAKESLKQCIANDIKHSRKKIWIPVK